ncbi:MAG: ArsI/CadI family heavy metal resistance metalloenzyme [Pirellulales bacterium]
MAANQHLEIDRMATLEEAQSTAIAAPTASVVRFHLSLNANDLAKSVAFYRVLFDRDPAKLHADYAKFEVDQPPLVLSLIPLPHQPGGVLNHVGLRLMGPEALVEVQARLEAAGFATEREEGVECCYARQTKFWVTDPDQTLWEFYVLHEDIHEHGENQTAALLQRLTTLHRPERDKVVWQHILSDPPPEHIPHEDGSVDEIRFEGSLNRAFQPGGREAFLAEAWRVLRPGGELSIHGLVGGSPYLRPNLPGPAALVEYVPSPEEAVQALLQAGFGQPRFAKLGKKACFVLQGIEMREMQLVANKPA